MARNLNVQRGLRRLTWVVGILLAVLFVLLELSKHDLSFGETWWGELLFVLLLIGLGIGIAWALHGLTLFVIRGFKNKERTTASGASPRGPVQIRPPAKPRR